MFLFLFFFIFAGEQFPTDLSAGAVTVKEATKARLNLVPCGCARTHDSYYLGLGYKYRSWRVSCNFIVQELCESRGGRPGLSVLTSLLVSVDVKIY